MSKQDYKKLALQTICVLIGIGIFVYLVILAIRWSNDYAAKQPPCAKHEVKSVQFSTSGFASHESYYVVFADGSAQTFEDPMNTPAVGQVECIGYWQ